MNRTLIDMARCLLIQSDLPTSLWTEVVATACYLRNRSPSRSHDTKTAYELMHQKLPDLRHIRVFGATILVLNKSPKRAKLQDRSIEGRLVGYSTTAKAFRVRLNTGKIIVTRDAAINEDYVLNNSQNGPVGIEYNTPSAENELTRHFEPVAD